MILSINLAFKHKLHGLYGSFLFVFILFRVNPCNPCLKFTHSVFQRVVNGSYHSDAFDVGSVGVAVIDAELPLRCPFDFAQFAVRILGELLGGFAGVLGGFFYHLWLHVVQPRVVIGDVVAVVASRDGDALLQQLPLFADEAPHQIYLAGGYGDDGGHIVSVGDRIAVVAFSLHVNDFGRIDADFVFGDSLFLQEIHDGAVRVAYLIISGRCLPLCTSKAKSPCWRVLPFRPNP